MQDIPQEQIDKRFQAIAESLQDAIFSEHTADTIRKSCILREAEEHLPTIATLTGRVLLGYLRPESFAFEIQKEAGIDALKATQVAHDIDAEVFSEVRLELKKLYPPTIQTPTVQAPGFSKQESGTGFQDSRFKIQEQKPAPRYVVPIPERFKKPEARNLKLETQNVQSEAQNLKPEIQDSGFRIQEKQVPTASPATPPQSVPPNEAKNYKLKADEGPPMDPVVPLPTFIQSKFKASELGVESGIKSAAPQAQPEIQDSRFKIQEKAPSAQDALKNAFGKFTVSSTATETQKEPVSPYRETIEEPKKPAEQKPTAKVQGKVIDLSKF